MHTLTRTARQQVILDAIEDEGGLWAIYVTVDGAYRYKPQLIEVVFSAEEAFDLANDCVAWVRWAWNYQRQVGFIKGNLDSAMAEVYEAMPHPRAHKKRLTFGLTYAVLRVW